MTPSDSTPGPNRRLDTWKEIGAFFGRDERTVKRWEVTRGLPVHRVPGAGRANVYANTKELIEWLKGENEIAELDSEISPSSPAEEAEAPYFTEPSPADSPLADPAVNERRVGERRNAGSVGRTSPLFDRRRREFRYFAIALVILAAVAVVAIMRRSWSARAARKEALVSQPRAIDPEAEQLYLKGIYYFNKRTPESLNQAVDYFTQAVVRDPQYAQPYVGMADSYNLLREYSVMPPSEAYPRAAAAAKRAIALDDSLAGAHSSLAFVDFYWSWDVPSAQSEFKRALELDPNSVRAHHWYATFLLHLGRFPESLEEIERAQKLDPESKSILADKGLILFYAGNTEQAVDLLKQLEASEPDFLSPHTYLAIIYASQGNWPQYLAESRKCAALLHDEHRLAVVAAGEKGFARGGSRGMLLAILKEQQSLYASGQERAYNLAQTSALLGDKEQALKDLQNSYLKRDTELTQLRIDPTLSTLHDEARFREILARVGLPALP
ncbi:MAG: tetratricopeptide repeat protein [Candidatus Acidiferrales bacterium]|jgi:tetratricopeptide (TPR) repeat protein